jgi:hypothetical protein
MRWWRLDGSKQRCWAAGSGCGEPLQEGPHWQDHVALALRVSSDNYSGLGGRALREGPARATLLLRGGGH